MALKSHADIAFIDAASVVRNPEGGNPAFLISTVICVAPASRLFSTSSLIAALGRSTTSPAAIFPIRSAGSILILAIFFSFYSFLAFSRSRNS